MKRAIGDRERARGRRPACASFSTLNSSAEYQPTCRLFGISRTLFYEWRRRYQREGLEGLRPRLPGPCAKGRPSGLNGP